MKDHVSNNVENFLERNIICSAGYSLRGVGLSSIIVYCGECEFQLMQTKLRFFFDFFTIIIILVIFYLNHLILLKITKRDSILRVRYLNTIIYHKSETVSIVHWSELVVEHLSYHDKHQLSNFLTIEFIPGTYYLCCVQKTHCLLYKTN